MVRAGYLSSNLYYGGEPSVDLSHYFAVDRDGLEGLGESIAVSLQLRQKRDLVIAGGAAVVLS